MAKRITESERCHDSDNWHSSVNWKRLKLASVNSIRCDNESDLYVSIEWRSLSIDNSRGSTDGSQLCSSQCNFFVPCVPCVYCAYRDATRRVVVLTMLFRISPDIVISWLRRTKRSFIALLSFMLSRFPAPRITATFPLRDFNVQSEFRPRHKLGKQRQKRYLHAADYYYADVCAR